MLGTSLKNKRAFERRWIRFAAFAAAWWLAGCSFFVPAPGSPGASCLEDIECDDHNACTLDRCAAGICESEVAVGISCPGAGICQAGECTATGTCRAIATPGASCDDGDPCTLNACGDAQTCTATPSGPLDGAVEICGDGIDNDCNPETLCFVYDDGIDAIDFFPAASDAGLEGFYYEVVGGTLAQDGRMTITMHQNSADTRSLIILLDKEDSPKGGDLNLSYSNAFGMSVLLYDDGPNNGNDDWDLKPGEGSGKIQWVWFDCCYDGMAFGYFAPDSCVDMKVEDFENLSGVTLWSDGALVFESEGLPPTFSICAAP